MTNMRNMIHPLINSKIFQQLLESCLSMHGQKSAILILFDTYRIFFLSASERRVLLIVGVCQTFSHFHIFSSSHHIFNSHIISSSHLHIFSCSHLLIFTFSHLHITTLHLLIFTASHPHMFTSSRVHIFSSSHLLIFASHLHIFSSWHLHTFTSSHLHIFSSSHPHILTSSHLHIFTFSLALLLSCPLALLPSCSLALFFFLFPECVARVPVSLWGSGGWGCVRSTLCLCSQPFATVRSRPQPFAWGPYGRAYGKFCRSGHFWRFQTSRCFVSRGRRGTSCHSDVFCNASKLVLCGRRNTFATFSEDVLQFSWQAQHFGGVHRHFAWRAQHFRRVVLRVFCKSHGQGCVKWRQGANTVAGVAFCEMGWKLTEASHEKSILRYQNFRFMRKLVGKRRFWCYKVSKWRKSRTKCSFCCSHVSRLESLVFLWPRRVDGGSCKPSPFRMFPSRLSCRFAWQAWHFVTFQPVFRTPHSTLPTPHFTLHTLHFTLHTLPLYSTLYTPHFTLCTVHSSLHTLHLTHSTLYTPHSLQVEVKVIPHCPFWVFPIVNAVSKKSSLSHPFDGFPMWTLDLLSVFYHLRSWNCRNHCILLVGRYSFECQKI